MLRQRVAGILGTVAVIALMAVMTAMSAAWPSSGRGGSDIEFVVVARDMRFFVEGAASGGPADTLALPVGRVVTIVLRNEDRSMRHNLVIESLDARTPDIEYGQETRVMVKTPSMPLTAEYYCGLHPRTMRGRLIVE